MKEPLLEQSSIDDEHYLDGIYICNQKPAHKTKLRSAASVLKPSPQPPSHTNDKASNKTKQLSALKSDLIRRNFILRSDLIKRYHPPVKKSLQQNPFESREFLMEEPKSYTPASAAAKYLRESPSVFSQLHDRVKRVTPMKLSKSGHLI